MKRDNWVPGQFSTICSAHFCKEDFDLTSLCRVRLREEAVPYVFPHAAITGKDIKERRLKRKCEDALSFTSDTDHSPRVYNSPSKTLRTELKTSQTHFRKEDFDLTSLCCVSLREEAVPYDFPHPAITGKDLKEQQRLKRKCDDELLFTSDTDHSPRVYKSPCITLRTELKTTQTKLSKSKKKIKYLQQKTRRLLKKVANLENTVSELKDKLNMSKESSALLDESISKTSECEGADIKLETPGYNKVFEDPMRPFSIT